MGQQLDGPQYSISAIFELCLGEILNLASWVNLARTSLDGAPPGLLMNVGELSGLHVQVVASCGRFIDDNTVVVQVLLCVLFLPTLPSFGLS